MTQFETSFRTIVDCVVAVLGAYFAPPQGHEARDTGRLTTGWWVIGALLDIIFVAIGAFVLSSVAFHDWLGLVISGMSPFPLVTRFP